MMRWELVRREIVIPLGVFMAAVAAMIGIILGLSHLIH